MMDSAQAMAKSESGAAGLGSSAVPDVDEIANVAKWLADNYSGFAKNLILFRESLVKRERELEELKSLQEGRSEELSLRAEKLEASRGEVEGLRRKEKEKLKNIERKEREIEELKSLQEGKSEELSLREEKLEALQVEVEGLRRKEKEKLKKIERKEREIDELKSLQEGKSEELSLREEKLEALQVEVEGLRRKEKEKLKKIERKEREIDELKSLQEGKSEELSLREEKLEGKSEELSLREEKLEALQVEVEGLRRNEREKLKKIERRERKIEELKWLQEERSEELSLKEGKLDEQLRSVQEHIERLEASQGEMEGLRREEREKLKEIDKRERELSVANGLLERRLDEVGEKLKELDAFRNGRLKEVALREQRFFKERRDFDEEVRLTNEKLSEKQRLGCGLIERLESALDALGGLKVIMYDKLKEIELREMMVNESSTSRANEADSIEESFEKTFNKLEDVEEDLHVFRQDYITGELGSKEQLLDTTRVEKSSEQQKLGLQMVENELVELKQGNVVSCKKEHDYEEHKRREKNPSCVKESLQTHVKENLAVSKLDQPQAEVVADKGQKVCRPREVESERQQHGIHVKEQGSKQPMLTDDHITIKPDKSVDSGQALQKDRETLEMLVTDPEKDSELMNGEICKILSQSSDPAKLVLDTVLGFCTLRSGKHDTECRVRRYTILLLDQLTKLSPKIQPCVTAAAVKFAFEWKSKLSATVEDSMEALGFLHFVAAFHLSSRFDKNELFKFLKLVGQHKQTPDLCRTLGLIAKIPGHIQNLINHKEYLLASTYAFEYQLQHRFKQAAILNYYLSYSKRCAYQQARNERNTFEAKDKAIVREIADLHAAVAHIIKYGLQDEYSPNVLSARIQQLESNRDNLRQGCPSTSSPADMWRKGNRKRSRYPNKWKDRRNLREASSNPQMPSWSPSPARRAEHQLGSTEMHPGAPPPGFPNPWPGVHLVPMPHPGPDGPYKRHCPNVWFNGGHLGQFGDQH